MNRIIQTFWSGWGSDNEDGSGSDDRNGSDDGSEDDSKGVTGNEGGNPGGFPGGNPGGGLNMPQEPKLSVPAALEKTGVRVVAKRYILTSKCTISVFEAQAYGQDGQKLSDFVVKGYFMERPYDVNLAEESGSKKAIQPGEYKIIPKIPGQHFKWYLEGVPGRAGIAIHAGNKPEDSLGCLLAGTSLVKIDALNYEVRGSVNKLNSLFSLFEMFGNGNISISISQ